jgi:hypothetical protein
MVRLGRVWSSSYSGSVKGNRGEPKSALGQVIKFKLACFCSYCICVAYTCTPTSRVENLAQVLSLLQKDFRELLLCPGSLLVEYSTHNSKLKGSYLANGTGKEKIVERVCP